MKIDIRQILKDSGLTIGKFADTLYVTPRTVHNWLAGSKKTQQKVRLIIDKYKSKQTT